MSKTATVTPDCKWFFADVARARERVLLVDYDGTIAPFSADRERAFPYPSVPELLQRIMANCMTRVILISGRAAHGVVPLLGMDPLPEIWGTHGLERLYSDGRYHGAEVTDQALDALADAEMGLENEALAHLLEVRPGAVAVHWRSLSPSEILEVRTKAYRILNPLALKTGLLVAEFDGGVEIRVRTANTGDAVRQLLAELEPDLPIAYLGDDTSDESAFRVLNDRGLTVLVRPQPRFSAAQVWLQPPDDLVNFLRDWIRAAGGHS